MFTSVVHSLEREDNAVVIVGKLHRADALWDPARVMDELRIGVPAPTVASERFLEVNH